MDVKIRAWDKKEKMMLEVGMWDMSDNTFYNLSNGDFLKCYSNYFKTHNEDKNEKPWGNPKDLILMLYSDMLDSNGNRLCDGDVVMYGDEVCSVIYQESCFYIDADTWMMPLSEVYSYELELIGNKFENPELLV